MVEQEHRLLAIAASLAEGLQFFDIDALTDFTGEKPSFLLGLLQKWQKNGWVDPLPKRGPGRFTLREDPRSFPWWTEAENTVTREDHARMADYFGRNLDGGAGRDKKVALHLEYAGEYERAASLMFEAGRQLLESRSPAAGLGYLERVLVLLRKAERTPSNSRFFLRAFVAAAEANPTFGRSKILSKVLDQVLETACSLPPEPLAVQALLSAAMGHLGLGHMGEVEPCCSEAWTRAHAVNDRECLRRATLCAGTVLYLRGRFREAVERYESTLGDTEVLPDDPLSMVTCILLAHCYALSGRISRALGLLDAILEKARALDYPSVALYVRGIMGLVLLETGRLSQAEEEFQQLAKEPGWKDQLVARSGWAWGMAYLRFRHGDLAGVAPYMETLFKPGHKIGNFFNPSGFEVAVVLGNLSDEEADRLGLTPYRDIMVERLEKSRGHAGSQAMISMFETMMAYPNRMTATAALKRLEELEEPLKDYGFHLALTRNRINQASLLYDLGRREEAAAKLRKSRTIIKECGTGFMPRHLSHVMGTEPTHRLMLRAVTEISRSLGTLLDRERLIRQAIDTINRITGAERGGLFLYEEEKLKLIASRGLSSDIVNQPAFDGSRRFIEEVVKGGRGAIQKLGQNPDSETQRAALAAPLLLRDKIVGVVYQDTSLSRGSFRAEDVALVQAFATQMAASLENARAFAEIERLNQKLAGEKDYYQEETHLSQRSGEIVYKSPQMAHVVSLADKVAETDTAVLIIGETGVGKDVVAREVHRRSNRKSSPFIRVDCAALPETLILSELFGHEKGAFTGADKVRVGRFELADGGTIFLDELGELPAEAQAKFLRILQEGEFERIGGTRTHRVKVRVVAATNRNLAREVKEGRFRSDLYYRLNVFPIQVPPLRERLDDIPPLTYFFLSASARKLGKSFPGITQKNMKKLFAYHWPGNVRELKHVVERSAILSPDRDFRVYLPSETGERGIESNEWPTLSDFEREYISRVLNHTGWKVAGSGGAAEMLGINRTTLLSRMKKLDIVKPWIRSNSS